MNIFQERKHIGAHNRDKSNHVHVLLGGEQVLLKNGNEKNEKGSEMAQAVPLEDLFNVLREGHVATGHGKEVVLYRHVTRRYFNITREMCAMFANDCATCVKLKNYAKKPRVGHKPIIAVGFRSREQVDLIDMQSSDYDGMEWLLTYCDHGTKFAATVPLPNKQVIVSSHNIAILVNYFPRLSIIRIAGLNNCKGPT